MGNSCCTLEGEKVPQTALNGEQPCSQRDAKAGGGAGNNLQNVEAPYAAAHSSEGQIHHSQNPGAVDNESNRQSEAPTALERMGEKEPIKEAKKVIRDFVKEMVKGMTINVMATSGQLRACICSLNRKLDEFRIKYGTQTRAIKLVDFDQIFIGTDCPDDLTTPLDELCCTIALESGDCISFRFTDLNQRDTFVMCMTMFVNSQKGDEESEEE